MSLYTKFRARIKDEFRHQHTSAPSEALSLNIVNLLGEEEFNKMMGPYIFENLGDTLDSEIAFSSFHKSLRTVDTFNSFFRGDEPINSHVEMLIYNFINMDKLEVFYKFFKFYFDLREVNVPTLEFLFQKEELSHRPNPKGLIGVRLSGQENLLSKKEFDKLYPGLEVISSLIEVGMRKLKVLNGEAEEVEGPRYASIDYPITSSGKNIEEIISWESINNKPFLFTNIIQ